MLDYFTIKHKEKDLIKIIEFAQKHRKKVQNLTLKDINQILEKNMNDQIVNLGEALENMVIAFDMLAAVGGLDNLEEEDQEILLAYRKEAVLANKGFDGRN